MKKRSLKIITVLITVFTASILTAICGVAAYAYYNIDFAADEELFAAARSGNVTKFYYDRDGMGLDDIAKYQAAEYEYVSGAAEHREWYAFSEIPEDLKNAFIATEDRKFYKHNGVDLKRTIAAVAGYITGYGDGFGASTITQQVIKNISGDNERTARRKLNEIVRAFHLEYSHSKEEIFEVYMNVAPMGEGVAGVGLAAERYFGKEPREMSLAECATLVGITNAPGRYNPYSNLDACIKKRNIVLGSLLECGYITENEYSGATKEPINLVERTRNSSRVYSWFVETVCDELIADLMREYSYSYDAARILVFNGGLSVYTTLDPEVQSILEEHFENGDILPPEVEDGLEISMVVTNKHADLCGIIGAQGEKRANRLLNYATTPHPPASALKPLALYAPLINSRSVTWSSMLDDSPVEIYEHEDGSITEYPHNSPDVYSGEITLSDALAHSKNTIAVRLYKMLGAERIYKNLTENYGFDTIIKSKVTPTGATVTDLAVSPLALGQLSYGVTLRKLTEAYTAFSAEGELHRARGYVLCLDSQGKTLISKEKQSNRVFSRECAQVMNQMLSRVVEVGTASKITLDAIIDTAGKTGTSAGSKDKIFVGYTPYYTAGIWCGYPDKSRSFAKSTHLELWDNVMKEIHELKLRSLESPDTFATDRVVRVAYCKDSGLRFSPDCADFESSTLEYGFFIKGTEPQGICKHSEYQPLSVTKNFNGYCFTFDICYDKIKEKRRRAL